MLHTKFRENRPAGSGEENFWVFFFIINGRGGHLGHVIRISRSNFRSPYPWMLQIEFHFDLPSILEKKIFEKCVWMTDRHIQGQLTPQPRVESGSNSKSSKML